MNTTNATTDNGAKRSKPVKRRYSSRLYAARVSHTQVGSPVITIAPVDPKGPSARNRQLAAFLYDLASEMETRSEELAAKWAISVEPLNDRVTVELCTEAERDRADAFVARLLSDRNLA